VASATRLEDAKETSLRNAQTRVQTKSERDEEKPARQDELVKKIAQNAGQF
jgi:hypothetical protein